MAEQRVQRRLAAILAADVVGYSRLMSDDETGTLAQLKTLRKEVFDPRTAEHNGRIVKTTGDGVLVEFASAVDATECAIKIQRALARRNEDVPEGRRIELRIGINLGDIIVDGDDIYGDGVNVAARLEGLCDVGQVYVSAVVHDQVQGKIEGRFDDLGEHTFKNIDKPIRVYLVSSGQRPFDASPVAIEMDKHFERPAVAVLPFENIGSDPDQEYFADGLTEDIITALSLWRSFPVVARNSTFAYKGTSPDIRRVGDDLGVRYVVEGSVRKSGNRVRVTAQLISTETGHHVWAERYDRNLEDIFDLQDEITQQIAGIIEPTIERTEQQRIVAKTPSDLVAWEHCLRGYALIYDGSEEANETAREMFNRAIALDPSYARAHTGLAYTYVKEYRFFPRPDRDELRKLVFETSRSAVALDETDAEARTMLARAYFFGGDYDAAITELRRAVALNPHRAFSCNVLGNTLAYTGQFEEGIRWIERALQLNPLDPQTHLFVTHLSLAHLGAGHYEQAAELAGDAIRRRPDFDEAHILLASALGHLDRADEANGAIGPFGEMALDFVNSRSFWAEVTKECVLEGLRKAGLPE